MKKIKLGIVLLALSLVLVSCGGTPEEKVENYLEKILDTQEMKDMITQTESEGMELTVLTEGTSLIYKYVYVANIDDMGGAEVVKQQLDTKINDPAVLEMQQSGLAVVKEECPSVTSVKYEYYDNQGNLITSAEVK